MAWPGVALEFETFRAHCGRVLGSAPEWDWTRFGAELYLCCACAMGDAAATRALEAETIPHVVKAISRIDADLIPENVRSSRRFHMPQFVVPPEGISYRDAEASFQRGLIESALEAAGGVQKRAAELLQIKPTTLNEMIKRHDIRPRRRKAGNGSRATEDDTDAEHETVA